MVPHPKTIYYLQSLIVVLLIAGIVQAQSSESRWIYVTEGSSGSTIYLEKSYVELFNGAKSIWAKFVNKNQNYTLQQNEFNCSKKI